MPLPSQCSKEFACIPEHFLDDAMDLLVLTSRIPKALESFVLVSILLMHFYYDLVLSNLRSVSAVPGCPVVMLPTRAPTLGLANKKCFIKLCCFQCVPKRPRPEVPFSEPLVEIFLMQSLWGCLFPYGSNLFFLQFCSVIAKYWSYSYL